MNKQEGYRGGLIVPLAALVVVLFGIHAARPIVVPFLLAFFISALCAPVLFFLRRRGMPLPMGLVVLVLALLIVDVALVAGLSSTFTRFSEVLPVYQARLSEALTAIERTASGWGLDLGETGILGIVDPRLVFGYVRDLFSNLGYVLGSGLLVTLIVIFLLLEVEPSRRKIAWICMQTGWTPPDIAGLVSTVNRYVALKALISLATGVTLALGLWALGVDFPLLWGLLAFLLNFIPNVGSVAAAIPPVLLASIQLGAVSAGAVALLFLVVNMLIGNFLDPRVLGKGLGLSPFIVLTSLIVWGWLLGPVGVVLAVPLTITVKLVLAAQAETRHFAVLLGADAPAVEES